MRNNYYFCSVFLLTEEELFSNLTVFNETCVKWQMRTGRLEVQKTYTVSGAVREAERSLVLDNFCESLLEISSVDFVYMLSFWLTLPCEPYRNLNVTGLGNKHIPVLMLAERLKSCWIQFLYSIFILAWNYRKHFSTSSSFSEIPLQSIDIENTAVCSLSLSVM